MSARGPVAARLLCAGVVLSAAMLSGATVVEMGPAELAAQADIVVRVRVTSAEAEWVPSSRSQRIITFHEASVLEVIGGTLNDGERALGRVRVGTLGGVVGDIEQKVSGAPRLGLGREYVLFLGFAGGPGGARSVVGMWQGAWDAGPELSQPARAQLSDALYLVRAVRP